MIDSHCHLADPQFTSDLEAVVGRARAAGVAGALCILDALDADEARQAARVAAAWPAVRFAVGVHPHQAGAFVDAPDRVTALVDAAFARRPGACAIGEIGLDYHYDPAPRRTQIDLFRRQIALARTLGRPIVIHTREADADTLEAVRADGGGAVAGVVHCFTGGPAFARQVLDAGLHVSFSGIVTFRNAAAIREAAALVPADRLLVETDAPYLAPAPWRGQRNEPARVTRVVDVVAEARGADPAEVAAAAQAAYERLFPPPPSPPGGAAADSGGAVG